MDINAAIEVGGWTLEPLLEGSLRLDGGAMWGVVPKNLWDAWTPAAADNTIALAARPFLARRGDHVVVIEAGVGARWDAKKREYFHLAGGHLEAALAARGVKPEDVTHTVASHAHWDHIGAWVVERDGREEPLFPKARHHLAAAEIQRCLDPEPVRRASYRSEDLRALEAARLLEPFSGQKELLPGLSVLEVGGHSAGISVVLIGAPGGERAVFWSDVCPTSHHIQPPYIMAYDIDVVRSFEQRRRLFGEAADQGWLSLFFHDSTRPLARLTRAGPRFVLSGL
jgi:glyoxylase-like metal-dependent hydrolase (beta-lactamase superfamily II)